jgi:hypothetical protein
VNLDDRPDKPFSILKVKLLYLSAESTVDGSDRFFTFYQFFRTINCGTVTVQHEPIAAFTPFSSVLLLMKFQPHTEFQN